MEDYFASLPADPPITSFEQLVVTNSAHPDIQKTLEEELNDPEYKERTLNRDKLRLAVAAKMAEFDLDAILYPLQKVVVALRGNRINRNAKVRCLTVQVSRRLRSQEASSPRQKMPSGCTCWRGTAWT